MSRQPSLTYGDGWFAEEQHQSGSFRWMSARARCHASGLPPSGPALLRITGGGWGPGGERPLLSVHVNGRPTGSALAGGEVGHCLFPFECSESLDIDLSLDRTFTVPGDGRVLGLMVRAIEVLTSEQLQQPVHAEGWYAWEDYEYFPFRWMGPSARILVPGPARPRGRFAQLPISSDCPDGGQTLTVAAGEEHLADLPLLRGWHVYEVALPPAGPGENGPEPLWLRLALDRLAPAEAHPGDARPLGARIGPLEIHDDRRRHEHVLRFHAEWAAGVPESHRVVAPGEATERGYRGIPIEGDGWFSEEFDDNGPFHWMRREGRLRITERMRQGARYCVVPMFSSFRNLAQEVTLVADASRVGPIALLKAWNAYSVELPPPTGEDLLVTLQLNRVPPPASHPDDPRELGIRVGDLWFHDDPARHERQVGMYQNAVRNQRELQEGVTVLASFPLLLGIDLYGKCNIKPACVYCLWDPMKALEGPHVDTPVDDRTLEGYGDFFRAAKRVVNCSFGEPLLHPRLEDVLAFAARSGKMAEISSNGQAFTPRTVRALEGKPIHLYVSLDSATGTTYARLRNDRWDEILTGLLFLRDARRRGSGWPRLNLVFMPMKANRQDIEMYFRLSKLVEADQIVLRPLLHLEDPGITRERGGYRFEYAQELLRREELEAIFSECGRHARRYGVRVISQFDFGRIEAPVIGEGRDRA